MPPATTAAAEPATAPSRTRPTVCAILLAGETGRALTATLDSLAEQTRVPDELLVIDSSTDDSPREAVRAHTALRAAIPDMEWVRGPSGGMPQESVMAALAANAESSGQRLPSADYLWLLTGDSVPSDEALELLLTAVAHDLTVAAAPKQLESRRPRTLRSMGIQVTRTGRLLPQPEAGEPDQGQYDQRTDVLAAPLSGLLVRRDVFEELGGFDTALGSLGSELDLGWRLHEAGHRLVVVPRASVLAHPDPSELAGRERYAATVPLAHRRQARRVALTRAPLWKLPFLAMWMALSGVLISLGLLLVKRPRAALSELQGVGVALTPWRARGSRRRSGRQSGRPVGRQSGRRGSLAGLFVPFGATLTHLGDRVHDAIAPSERRRRRSEGEGLESGPTEEGDTQGLETMPDSVVGRASRHPAILAVLLTLITTAVAGRALPGGIWQRFTAGLAGGELLGVRADSSSLWHAWLDGWQGAGLGHPATTPPHLPLLAALTWLGERIPGVADSDSPAGAVLASLLLLGLPLAVSSAYLAGRAVTRRRLPRAAAALLWGTTALATSSLGSGRFGALVVLVLLPLVAAGLVSVFRTTGTFTGAFATALAAAVVGSVAPGLLVVALLLALVALLVRPASRWRALSVLVTAPLLLGPWLGSLVDDPRLLLSGTGLAAWGTPAPQPWELALLHPGGAGSYPVLLSAPLVLAGVMALLHRTRHPRVMTGLAVLAVLFLAATLAAPRVALARIPAGTSGEGGLVSVWPGLPMFGYALALCAAVLVALDDIAPGATVGRGLLRVPMTAVTVAAAAVGLLAFGYWGMGSALHAWEDPRAAVAVDQADGAPANRVLLLDRSGSALRYRLIGREVTDIARTLPYTDHQAAAASRRDPQLDAAIGGLVDSGSSADSPAAVLAERAVGFVSLRAAGEDPMVRRLDATGGLTRLGEKDGVILWRVEPPTAAGAQTAVAPSRLRLVTGGQSRLVPTTGQHGTTTTRIEAGEAAQLIVAEPLEWSRRAVVSVDGRAIAPLSDAPQPTYAVPAGTHDLTVDVRPAHRWWQLAQALLLALTVFLAVPFGRRATRTIAARPAAASDGSGASARRQA
ncbi:MAG: glycosyltransferase [Micrococcales bacterium]|nr:glycosyltransferase [Micrococcales bacterium]